MDRHRRTLHTCSVSCAQNFCHWKTALEALVLISYCVYRRSLRRLYRGRAPIRHILLLLMSWRLRDKYSAHSTVRNTFIADNSWMRALVSRSFSSDWNTRGRRWDITSSWFNQTRMFRFVCGLWCVLGQSGVLKRFLLLTFSISFLTKFGY